MSELEFFEFILTPLMGVVLWFLKRLISKNEEDTKELRTELDHIKEHYLRKDDFREFKEELKEIFREIKDDLKKLMVAK